MWSEAELTLQGSAEDRNCATDSASIRWLTPRQQNESYRVMCSSCGPTLTRATWCNPHDTLWRWHSGKACAHQCRRRMGRSSTPEPGRSPGVENGNPLQYSCWKIPWAEETGGLLFKWSQRVNDWACTLPQDTLVQRWGNAGSER